MGHKITLRFLFVYIATVTAMFFLVNAIGQSRLRRSLLENRKDAMIQEAQKIAVEYGENYYRSGITITIFSRRVGLSANSRPAFLSNSARAQPVR